MNFSYDDFFLLFSYLIHHNYHINLVAAMYTPGNTSMGKLLSFFTLSYMA